MKDFDPDQYLADNDLSRNPDAKGDFDPDAYLSSVGPKPGSASDAFLGQASDTALMGYAPQIVAGLTKGAIGVHNLFSDNDIVQPEYVKLRDEVRSDMNRAKDAHPYAAGAGTAAGIIGTMPLLATKAVQSATAGKRIADAAKVGAAMGAIQNPGDQEGEIDPFQFGKRTTNAAIGAGIGGAVSGAIEGLPYAVNKIKGAASYLDDLANEKAAKTLGHLSKFEGAADKGTAKEIGKLLREEGMIKPWSRPESLLPKVEKLKKLAGQDIGDIIGKADKGVSIDFERMAIELLDDPDVQRLATTPGMESSYNKVLGMLETLSKNKDLGLKEAQNLRQGIDQGIKFSRRGDAPVPEEFARRMRTGIRDTMNDVVNASDQMNGMPSANRLKDANKRFSLLSEAEDIADQQVARNSKNRAFGLTDTIAAGAGLTTGGPGLAAITGAANKAIRTFGNANASLAAGGTAKALMKIPRFADLAQNNPSAFNALVQRMGARMGGEGALESAPALSPRLLQQFSENPELIDQLTDENLKERLRKELDKNRNPATMEPISPDQAKEMFLKGN